MKVETLYMKRVLGRALELSVTTADHTEFRYTVSEGYTGKVRASATLDSYELAIELGRRALKAALEALTAQV